MNYIDAKNALRTVVINEINELKQKHEKEIQKLTHSFAKEIEDLQSALSSASSQINLLISEKSYHGKKFIEILDKAKEKNKEAKTENKRLLKKFEKLEAEYDKIIDKHNHTLKEKEHFETENKTLKEYIEKTERDVKELKKKLYKFEISDDVASLDPYELHRKIRYYEAQIDYNDAENMKTRKDLKELTDYLDYLGITKEDLKTSCVTGVLQVQNFNSKWFELKYRREKSSKESLFRPRKSISCHKKDELIKNKKCPLEKYDEIRRALNSSKTKNYETNQDKNGEEDTHSYSSDTRKSSKVDSDLAHAERKISNVPIINDFARNKPWTELEIMSFLSKTKMTEEYINRESDNDFLWQSFEMKSRKRDYDQKIGSSKFCPQLI